MHRSKTLQDAMSRVLDADADSNPSPTPVSRMRRFLALRAARIIFSEWKEEHLTTDEAVARLDALASAMRES
jgi:hypothetical protein